jgi:hypothetical protein
MGAGASQSVKNGTTMRLSINGLLTMGMWLVYLLKGKITTAIIPHKIAHGYPVTSNKEIDEIVGICLSMAKP